MQGRPTESCVATDYYKRILQVVGQHSVTLMAPEEACLGGAIPPYLGVAGTSVRGQGNAGSGGVGGLQVNCSCRFAPAGQHRCAGVITSITSHAL